MRAVSFGRDSSARMQTVAEIIQENRRMLAR